MAAATLGWCVIPYRPSTAMTAKHATIIGIGPTARPRAAKLKPAAPVAEKGSRFFEETLGTRIAMDHSSTQANACP